MFAVFSLLGLITLLGQLLETEMHSLWQHNQVSNPNDEIQHIMIPEPSLKKKLGRVISQS